MNNTYPNEFYTSRTGVKIKDSEIKRWLEEIKNDLMDAEIGAHSFRSSGNTMVIGIKYQDEYVFMVSDNYKELSVFPSETDMSDVKF